MKNWAQSHGATHYCHWFQPLTGGTAEKHDSFIDYDKHMNVISRFAGSNLIKGEADASSLPNGAIRSTFEARGYTLWDPCSPAFLKKVKNSTILCIPTAYCSYSGDILDEKTPLIKACDVLNF